MQSWIPHSRRLFHFARIVRRGLIKNFIRNFPTDFAQRKLRSFFRFGKKVARIICRRLSFLRIREWCNECRKVDVSAKFRPVENAKQAVALKDVVNFAFLIRQLSHLLRESLHFPSWELIITSTREASCFCINRTFPLYLLKWTTSLSHCWTIRVPWFGFYDKNEK